MSGKCFYCNSVLAPAGASAAGPAATVDHVFPRAMLRQFVGPLPDWWRKANRVQCCPECNTRKADKHPALWLATLPHGPGRDRLASRLHKLGTLCQRRVPGDHIGRHQPAAGQGEGMRP